MDLPVVESALPDPRFLNNERTRIAGETSTYHAGCADRKSTLSFRARGAERKVELKPEGEARDAALRRGVSTAAA